MMKKIILYKIVVPILVFFGVTFLASGQDVSDFQVSLDEGYSITKNSFGVRIGYEKEFNGEVSYQRRFFESNRLEIGLGFKNEEYTGVILHNTKLTAIYQYLWNIPERYTLYIGLGAGYGHWQYSVKEKKYNDNGNFSFLTGQIGIEYRFKYIPFSVSLDCRPEYINNWWREDTHFVAELAAAVRYKF